MNRTCLYSAPFGPITLEFDEHNNLVKLELSGKPEYAPHPLPEKWQDKLDAYFCGSMLDFGHPVSKNGTAYQRKVWQAIAEIPAGQVMTYQDIARKIGSHPRAVGGACGKNPLALVIPCHRVVAKTGLGGFSSGEEKALAVKHWLLAHEGIHIPMPV